MTRPLRSETLKNKNTPQVKTFPIHKQVNQMKLIGYITKQLFYQVVTKPNGYTML